MRLIDADALFQAMENAEWYNNADRDEVAEKLVINAPTIEERTGRWIRKANWMWTCSCCGSDNAYAYKADDAYEPTVLQDFFCFNCGSYNGGNR